MNRPVISHSTTPHEEVAVNMPKSRLLMIAPVLAFGLVIAVGKGATAAFGLVSDQRLVDAKDTMKDLVHAGASEVATQTGPEADADRPKALQADRMVTGGTAQREAPNRRAVRRSERRSERRSNSLPTRSHQGQDIPDFARLQSGDAHSTSSRSSRTGRRSASGPGSGPGRHSGRLPAR